MKRQVQLVYRNYHSVFLVHVFEFEISINQIENTIKILSHYHKYVFEYYSHKNQAMFIQKRGVLTQKLERRRDRHNG